MTICFVASSDVMSRTLDAAIVGAGGAGHATAFLLACGGLRELSV
jgi:thioredoxin reductase